MDIYMPTTAKEFSQRKLEEYAKYQKVITEGRKNPIWFMENFLGVKLMDYQSWMMMETWNKPFALWLCSRGAGKTTLAAVYLQTKMILIPDYKVYISTNSAAQSIEVFKKIEDIALQRIPSFKTCTDIFMHEIEKSGTSETGFIHDPSGHRFRLFNNSELVTLSTNLNAIRGKRGSVLYDETAWQTAEQMAVTENFINVDTSFQLGTEKIKHYEPKQMPLQLLYASSAGDVTFPFFEKYKSFAKKMFMGDKNYFVCDINAYTILDHSSVDGEQIKSHLTREQIEKSIEEDPDLADRELFNKFRKGGGQNAVVSMDTLIRNSQVRPPLLYNDTGKKKFIFCYDPARNFDGSALSIFEVINDKDAGYKLKLVNVVAMIDENSKNKTPLPMPAQLDIIKDLMIKYNGERAAEWENIEFYCDSGSGGGGISAICDQLMDDWVGSDGIKHRGIIDPEHKQYETARKKYTNAMPIVHLIDPQGFKKVIYEALGRMCKLNLISFTDYDGKDEIMIDEGKGEFKTYTLTSEEKLSLTNINLLKLEVSYMCRYDTPNGGVQYELAKEKKNKMHDDKAYTCAMGAYGLAILRREDLLKDTGQKHDYSHMPSLVSTINF